MTPRSISLVFYGHPESGHSYKVALALSMLELAHEYRWVDVYAPRDQRAADFRAASPFGEIPILVVDGVPLAQSNAILLHLMRRTPGWAVKRKRARRRCSSGSSGRRIGSASRWGTTAHSCPRNSRTPVAPEVVAWFKECVESSAERLEREVSKRPFCSATRSPSRTFRVRRISSSHEAGLDVAAWPGVHGWLNRITSQRGFRRIAELMHEQTT